MGSKGGASGPGDAGAVGVGQNRDTNWLKPPAITAGAWNAMSTITSVLRGDVCLAVIKCQDSTTLGASREGGAQWGESFLTAVCFTEDETFFIPLKVKVLLHIL